MAQVKDEFAFSAGGIGHKGDAGGLTRRDLETACVHVFGLQAGAQQAPKGVVAHAADKANRRAQAGGRHGKDGRCAAGKGTLKVSWLVQGLSYAGAHYFYQCFANGDDVGRHVGFSCSVWLVAGVDDDLA